MRRPSQVGRSRWLLACAMTPGATLRFVYHPPDFPEGHRCVYVYRPERWPDVGVLTWNVCDACRLGRILKISLQVQRQGVGRHLIMRALRDGPGYDWATSSQSPDGKQFFAAMAAETGCAFTSGAKPCAHMDDRRFWGSPLHQPRAVVDRSLTIYQPVRMP